eukprot:CAMPEP_0117885202 /NCGR_PEP_ID=MMETSP0950-20121206/19469_1 /TAXON_ID=44440 /ORGANISM="Chattonella subsalsa, Strain CCMP2191" /LENGTH=326 /DNA_ID=CAMNT_0005741983 /DNA_START=51 /DNA_END=1031 /DNA_ORIENTATION=+
MSIPEKIEEIVTQFEDEMLQVDIYQKISEIAALLHVREKIRLRFQQDPYELFLKNDHGDLIGEGKWLKDNFEVEKMNEVHTINGGSYIDATVCFGRPIPSKKRKAEGGDAANIKLHFTYRRQTFAPKDDDAETHVGLDHFNGDIQNEDVQTHENFSPSPKSKLCDRNQETKTKMEPPVASKENCKEIFEPRTVITYKIEASRDFGCPTTLIEAGIHGSGIAPSSYKLPLGAIEAWMEGEVPEKENNDLPDFHFVEAKEDCIKDFGLWLQVQKLSLEDLVYFLFLFPFLEEDFDLYGCVFESLFTKESVTSASPSSEEERDSDDLPS